MDTPAHSSQRRLLLVFAIVACLLFLLIARLWQVQVRQTEDYRQSISRQSIRRLRLPPVRGRILAADGSVLVDNRPSRDLVFYPGEMRRPGVRRHTIEHILAQAGALAELIGRENRLDPGKIEYHLYHYPALPLTVFEDLSDRETALVAEFPAAPAGMEIRVRPVRHYPRPGLATHILGFTGRQLPLDDFELKKYSYVDRELRGREGLELYYDSELAGQGGEKIVRVDTRGFVHEEIGETKPPRNGHDLILTIDPRAQAAAESALGNIAGALVLLQAGGGGVLAMASSPTYDLAELTAARYNQLRRDERSRPLLNRALLAGFTPGSIIKPLIGLAAMNTGIADEHTEVECNGAWRIGKTGRIRCWNRYGHGKLDMAHAIEQSCNTYFIELGVQVGLEGLTPVLAAAGIGRAPEIDLAGAGAGTFPTRELARHKWKRPWIAIDTAFISIGQGAISLSPLQAAGFVAAIANGGTLYRPHLLHAVRDTNGELRRIVPPQPASRLPVTPASLALVRQGMRLVVAGEHATAGHAKTPVITLAGKTGTAEVARGRERTKIAWFVCFAPAEEPRYAMALMIEEGVSGGQTAGPLAKRFFESWLGTAATTN